MTIMQMKYKVLFLHVKLFCKDYLTTKISLENFKGFQLLDENYFRTSICFFITESIFCFFESLARMPMGNYFEDRVIL